MWKKSGAWFYREMPNYTKPSDATLILNNSNSSYCNGMPFLIGTGTCVNRLYENGRNSPQLSSLLINKNKWPSGKTTELSSRYDKFSQNDTYDKISMYEDDTIISKQKDSTTVLNNTIPATGMFGLSGWRMTQRNAKISSNGIMGTKPLPIPTDQQQRFEFNQNFKQIVINFFRLKTTPRSRITPSWVHEKIQSSVSSEDEDEEENEDEVTNGSGTGSTSSLDIQPPTSKEVYRGSSTMNNFKVKKEINQNSNLQKSNQGIRKLNQLNSSTVRTAKKHYNRPKELQQQPGGSSNSSASVISASRKNLAKFLLSNRNRITDTGILYI